MLLDLYVDLLYEYFVFSYMSSTEEG